MKQTLAILGILTCLSVDRAHAEQNRRPSPYAQRLASRSQRPAAELAFRSRGDEFLHRAEVSLGNRASVSGKIKQQVDVFGQRLLGAGFYLQKGRGPETKIRLELRLTVADETSSMMQVSDGRFLWIHQQVLNQTLLHRIDMSRIQRAMQDDSWLSRSVSARGWPAAGGLPKLLEGLSANFYFDEPTESQLGGLAVWVLHGQWRPSLLASLLPSQKEAILAGQRADLMPLPEQIPHRVVIALGKDDLFPYRVEYWRSLPFDLQNSAGTPPEQEMLVMDLLEVEFDQPLDDRKFTYRAGEQSYEDRTDEYLRNLGLRID